MIKEENIIEAINAQKFSSNKEYYIEIYKTIMLSDLMKNQYEKIEQKVEKSKDKLYDNLTIISNTKNTQKVILNTGQRKMENYFFKI